MKAAGNDEDIGRTVSELRAGRTQQAIADAMRERGLKWSQTTVWTVEKGERPLKLREAAVLASVLGTTVETLVECDAAANIISARLAAADDRIATLEQELQRLRELTADTEAELADTRNQREHLNRDYQDTRFESFKEGYERMTAAKEGVQNGVNPEA